MSDSTDAVRVESAVEQAIRIARELEPEQWSKIDHIAEMIDPAAFAEYYSTGERPVLVARRKYMQSRARSLAYQIMQYLGAAPATTNWTPIFERMVIENDPTLHEQQNADPDSHPVEP